MKKYNLKKISIIGCCLVVLLIVGITIGTNYLNSSYSVVLENDVEVEPESELTYYLNVNYNGVDINGTQSSDTTVAQVNSSTISIEDKIPEGLTFMGFVTTDDGSIGAVRRSDNTTACVGKVVDDTNEESVTEGTWNDDNTEYTYHGLHYNKTTGTVSFKVKNLQAGCTLVVGIITKTPTIDDPDTDEVETRRDFYNYAIGSEKKLTAKSNTVHVFMGSETVDLYNVTYVYTGDVPSTAPSVPEAMSYAVGASVGISNNIDVTGYTFSGWSTTDVTITNSSFTMPASNVTLTGSFTKISETYDVKYEISGNIPEGYILPSTKSYYEGETVSLDSLEKGDVFNGYRFLGWTSDDVTISSDADFEMPSQNVTITGSFELVTYQVIYKFYDTVLPSNSDSLLPETVSYRPGSTVTLADVSNVEGYKFLGWYKEDNFVMPSEDVIIYGEWMKQAGTFAPTIAKEIINQKDYYEIGDIVDFKIIVTNTASYEIKSVIVKEDTEGSIFIDGDGYTVKSDHFATIDTISAGESVVVYAQYTVTTNDADTVTNEAEIKGALADNNYILEDKEYKASVTFVIEPRLIVCKNVDGNDTTDIFNFNISSNGSSVKTFGLANNQCETTYLEPGTYSIEEILLDGYSIKEINGSISNNGDSITLEKGNTYKVTYVNKYNLINPQTGEKIFRWFIVLALSGVLIILSTMALNRKRNA